VETSANLRTPSLRKTQSNLDRYKSGGGGFKGPPNPDFLHIDQNVNPDFEGGSESGITELKTKTI
jgi:hypothetical protein